MTSTWVDQAKRTVFLGYFRNAADEELEDRDEAAREFEFETRREFRGIGVPDY